MYFFFFQYHHMSLMDFVVSLPGCGRSVTDFWGWEAHEAQLRCPDEVDGDIWIWSTRGALNLASAKLPRPWSAWESSLSRKNPHGRAGNRTRDIIISSQKLWPLDHEAGLWMDFNGIYYEQCCFSQTRCRNFYFPTIGNINVATKEFVRWVR
jgi:hypothetical protein